MNTLSALSSLWQYRPAADALPATVAAWYQAKGYLHEQLAAEAMPGPEQAQEMAYAATAYEHARRLLAHPDRSDTEHDVVVPAQRTASPVMPRQEART
jgi:hypothetical protein